MIRLTEGDLHMIVKESVQMILKESLSASDIQQWKWKGDDFYVNGKNVGYIEQNGPELIGYVYFMDYDRPTKQNIGGNNIEQIKKNIENFVYRHFEDVMNAV